MDFCSEEQRNAVLSNDDKMLICGCAGSRKTDTLVKICVREFNNKTVNIMIATLVGSVTNEIKERLENALDATFCRKNNHFIFTDYRGASIEIANFDAMIHKQLEIHKEPFLIRFGDCHQEKADILLNKYILTGKHENIYLGNNKPADVFLMDEFQDLQPTKVKILTEIITRSDRKIKAVAAGDYIQTIFDHAFDVSNEHPMHMWNKDLHASTFKMSECFRCPNYHVALANTLLNPYYDKFGLSPMISNNNDTYRPIMFVCPPTSKNNTGDIVAHQVLHAIDCLYEIETGQLHPNDIAIIMGRSNNNHVFRQLAFHLDNLYTKWGYVGKDSVKIFETRGDGYNVPIDWSLAEGKTVLLSIHGDKGKGHKVVFFLGFNEGSIPQKTRVFTDKELVDLSLMNVALTRSTKWLFVGFNKDFPSRYLRGADLNEIAALSWDETSVMSTDEAKLIKSINNCYKSFTNNYEPNFHNPHYVNQKINSPSKNILEVKDDIVSMYEHPKGIVPYYDWSKQTKTKFGKECNFSLLPDDLLPIFGIMGELLLQRELSIRMKNIQLFDTLEKCNKGFFTSCNRLLNICQDISLNQIVSEGCTKHEYQGTILTMNVNFKQYIESSERTKNELIRLKSINQNIFILPKYLHSYLGIIDIFCNKDIKTSQLTSKQAWITSLFFIAIFGKVRIPYSKNLISVFDNDISSLVINIEKCCDLIMSSPNLTFQVRRSLIGVERRLDVIKDMGILNTDKVSYGIVGVSDFESNDCIFEVKCPRSSNFSNTWIIQPLIYKAIANDNRKKKIAIIDLINGILYEYDRMELVNDRHIVKTILNKAKFRDEHIISLACRMK
jgi:superfamily I DNA/RNA helicase